MSNEPRTEFVEWLRVYGGGAEAWKDNLLMCEHDAALAAWLHQERKIRALRVSLQTILDERPTLDGYSGAEIAARAVLARIA